MSVKFGDSNIGAEIGTPSLNASITKPSINVNFNAPSLGASGGNTILRELVNPQFFIGTVTTLEPGEDVYCYLTGTKDAPVLNFGIPKGYKGDPGADGADGQAATIAVGSVSTGLPTDPASVTNSGTSSAAVFDFVIPKGDKGDTGATGATGAGVASGGTTGQVLKKKSSTNYDTEWGAVEAVPQGGTTGQVLAKKTNTDFDIEWIDPPDGTVTDVEVNGSSVVTSGVAQVTVPEPAPTSGATPSTDTQYGSVGTSTQYARKDHRHTSNFPTTGTPADLGTAANGTSATYAHSDHVHNYPTIVHVGASAPSDSNIEVWLDTDEQGASVVTSVDGQSGAVTVLPQGGDSGNMLVKSSSNDYDVEWLGVKTGTASAATGFTLNEVQVKQFGRMVMVKFYASKNSGTITANTATNIASISGVSLPSTNMRFMAGCGDFAYSANKGCYAILATNGNIDVNTSANAKVVNFCLTYILDS